MLRCGLLGETLGHSYSPMIHHELGEYDYRLFEVSKEDLDAFLCSDRWDGLNVTIPYKKAVVPYCVELSEAAAKLQSVNTLVRRPDGTLYGDNTDLFGFLYMVRSSGIDPAGKKALVLGSGGASVTVKAALEQLGADVTVISRSGPDDYDHLDRHADAQIIANTTPVGMYPHNGAAAVDLRRFSRCEGVLDIVYNPARTALLLQAEELGIPHAGGLSMLVAQAKRSSEQFTGTAIGDEALARVERAVNQRLRNIILIGMPGSGKSAVAAALGKALGGKRLGDQPVGVHVDKVRVAQGLAPVCKAQLDGLMYPLLRLGYGTHLAGQSHLAENHALWIHRLILHAGYQSHNDGKVERRFVHPHAACDIHVCIVAGHLVSAALFQHSDQQVHTVEIRPCCGTPRHAKVCLGHKRLHFQEDWSASL